MKERERYFRETFRPNFQRHRLAQPTFIIEARLEVGVTLSVELLTPDGFWAEDDAFVVVCEDGSVSIGVDVDDRWLLLLLLLNVLSDE